MTTTHSSVRTMLALFAAVAMIFALSPAGVASAASPIAGAVEGHADLPAGIGACGVQGTFTGSVVVGVHGTNAVVSGGASASFTYCNTNTVQGTADGDLTLDGHTCGFSWIRAGVTAIVTFDEGCTGAAVAVFVPDVDQQGATVVGAGAGI